MRSLLHPSSIMTTRCSGVDDYDGSMFQEIIQISLNAILYGGGTPKNSRYAIVRNYMT